MQKHSIQLPEKKDLFVSPFKVICKIPKILSIKIQLLVFQSTQDRFINFHYFKFLTFMLTSNIYPDIKTALLNFYTLGYIDS